MGAVSRFICLACGYEAEVSGGPDAGLAVDTITIVCRDCAELYDVVVQEHRPQEPVVAYSPRCPQSATHVCAPWNDPGPCPRCATEMIQAEHILYWD